MKNITILKPQELRIGNWVLEALNERNEEFATAKVIAAHLHNTTFLKPIPLTPEWLEKFGFEKSEPIEGVYWFNEASKNGGDFDTYELIIIKHKGFNFVILSNPEGSYSVPINHVHQLQNLYFALTGEEL